jgi:hypothetical protein
MQQIKNSTSATNRRVFDCCLFNGEVDVLRIRLHELDRVVNTFVIVESNKTFSGKARKIAFNPCDPRISEFASKVRHLVVTDMPETTDPWTRERWQRNAVLRGVPDAAATDLLVLSDVDEIPRSTVVAQMATDHENEVFGVRLAFSYFYVNYRNVEGPQSALTWTVAATRRELDRVSPDELRYFVREGRVHSKIIDEGGWHFSYLMDKEGIRQKIAAFSHQEFNNVEFLDKLDVLSMVRERRDLFNRPGFRWEVVSDPSLPEWLLSNRRRLNHLFYPADAIDRAKDALSSLSGLLPIRTRAKLPPIVLCPYVCDHEADEVRSKFGLDRRSTKRAEFYLWQDKERIGPELALERCWDLFPTRDVIVIHSDMAPEPGEPFLQWYDALVSYRGELPSAGMIACNLYYNPTSNGAVNVQCAGGTFADARINHLHGGLDEPEGIASELLKRVRPVDWVTFGGVLIRRELIRACGPFDRRYKWDYVMDVDYSFEARLRGFQLMQVPVSLRREENRTTRSLWQKKLELRDHIEQNARQFYAKWEPFYRALGISSSITQKIVNVGARLHRFPK